MIVDLSLSPACKHARHKILIKTPALASGVFFVFVQVYWAATSQRRLGWSINQRPLRLAALNPTDLLSEVVWFVRRLVSPNLLLVWRCVVPWATLRTQACCPTSAPFLLSLTVLHSDHGSAPAPVSDLVDRYLLLRLMGLGQWLQNQSLVPDPEML